MKLSSAQVKICQIPYVNFETHNKSIPHRILYHSSVSWKITPLHFFSSDNIYFAQKEPIKVNIFETFKWSGQNLSNSSCQFSNDKLIPLQIFVSLFNVMKDNSSVFFSSSNIYFAQKEPIKGKIFVTSKCSSQTMSNSSCQFWNDKSIPLQILYHPSVSWKIIPLYFFSSNNIYSAQKEPIKVKIFEIFKCSGQNSSNPPMSILKRHVDSSPNFVSIFNVMKDNSSVLF